MLQKVQAYDCPCCGNTIGEAAPIDTVIERFSGAGREMLSVLSRNVGKYVRGEALMNAMFDHRADGGPDTAKSVFHVIVFRIRRQLAPHGWTIVMKPSGASEMALYRLIPTEAGL